MILAIDVGNSITTIGLFDKGGELRLRSDLPTAARTARDRCAIDLQGVFSLHREDIHCVTGSIVSSVVPQVTADVCGAVELLTGTAPLLMGPGIRTGLNIKSDTHTQMGTDIVAYSVGAAAKYPSPAIVVDMGTAVTMSYLRGNTYEGCIIMPGVRVALEALSDRAAELPHISIEAPGDILGRNTVDAMRAGIIYGNASMIDGMIARLEASAGSVAAVVGTGNAGAEILKYCSRTIHYDPDLLLSGLYLIYQKNTGKQRSL